MIEVAGLTFTYRKAAVPALHGLDFAVGEGEILGFLGPSGSGKSTTQKILIGLLGGFDGSVRVMGRAPADWGTAYYERIGVSFERPNHYLKLTGLENLRYFASLYHGNGADLQALLAQVDLAEDGDRPVAAYSKGMQNRLNVARALVHNPPLLFLDEPTSGLDPANARRIKDLILQRRNDGATVFLCTHNMTVAEEVCDRVAFLVDGRILLIDSPRALKLRYGKRSVRVEYGGESRTAVAEFPLEGLDGNHAFLSLLRRDDLQTIHTQETTLEAIFLDVTGRHLE